jgi:hypothetical protein
MMMMIIIMTTTDMTMVVDDGSVNGDNGYNIQNNNTNKYWSLLY